MNVKDASLKNIGNAIKNAASDLLTNSDFISRTIGMTASYDDIMFIVQALGREPISLLGKDYPFIFDHVRRNFQQGVSIPSMMYGGGEYGCAKFTFYKDPPTVRFADPYQDPLNLLDRWTPNMKFESTKSEQVDKFYAESNDGETNNKNIGQVSSNMGVATGKYSTSFNNLTTCDLIKKTNDNFNHGKYKTLIARFHTNSMDSRDLEDSTQTAFTNKYGMSHGRNLLKLKPTEENGYNNPYCRVWTYHHQYNTLKDVIRPFGDVRSENGYEKLELGNKYGKGGFRTVGDDNFKGGSSRLDKHGVLNYENGFVNIAPTAKIKDYFEGKEDTEKSISTKKCMFSIENLAWRDDNMNKSEYNDNGLSPEQRGPLGGRIMWFPPYDLTFSEDVRVDWNGNKFIGRGEQIYTYTNTERTGNLSFTLLIDHPSILDYWTGHQRNGQSNMGEALIGGNDGGVDEINNQENTLLRFFAGCQVLTAKPQNFYQKEKEEKKGEKEDPTLEPEVPEVERAKPIKKKIQAILFYPNNYSGVDDNGGVVNPIYYLMNGIGTQKRINEITKLAEDFAADVEHTAIADGYGTVGGYETQSSRGISIITSADTLNPNHADIVKTYADTTSKERKGQYLSTKNGISIAYEYSGGEPNFRAANLAKIIGSQAMGLGSAYGTNLTGDKHLWYRKRYYYRVDKAYENQDFSHKESYIDGISYGLNRSGFNKVRQHSNVIKNFSIEDDSETYMLISFTDLFLGLEGEKEPITQVNKSNVRLVREIFNNKEKYSNIKISFTGHASYQGRTDSNIDLAANRALTLRNWLQKRNLEGVEFGDVTIINQPLDEKINVGGSDDELPKIWRSASVVIEYDEQAESNAVETKSTIQTNNGVVVTDEKTGEPLNEVDKVEVPNGKTSQKINNAITDRNLLIRSIYDGKVPDKPNLDELNKLYKKVNGISDDDGKYVKRYDNEGEFFELLSRESPFLHNLITEKIKYFDPAFHAISPEGFNARLTFLHQCTRQGATIEAGSNNMFTAYNLAFGRPPICVLRLGDFYYTKIIINNLSIQYENAQWDLNPEGIGVMPMFAKVSIQFTFLGGSDIAGPIARLQNAVSFNYYANASVYDDRAEMVEYDPSGNGKVVKYKGFVYPEIKPQKGGLDEEEFNKWMNGFYKDINVSNSDEKQSDDNILKYDKNFK